jgi:DNA replication protein DnaC
MDTWSDGTRETNTESICPICKGARFVHPTLPSGKPDFSRLDTCRCILKQKGEERQIKLEQYSNLGALSRLTFDNLLPQGMKHTC